MGAAPTTIAASLPRSVLTETNFRALAAVALRYQGQTFRLIGERLGVGPTQARALFERGERILKYSPWLNPRAKLEGGR